MADHLHLVSALTALLDNAIKYSGGTPKIEIHSRDEDDGTRIIIADEGIGIPEEHRARVFEKFYRVPTGDVHDVKGFGLGLFYVKGVCEAHGYSLQIDPDREQGTAFIITIPYKDREVSFWRKLKLRIFGPSSSSNTPEWTQA